MVLVSRFPHAILVRWVSADLRVSSAQLTFTVFAWVTWIRPQNVIINQIFGGATGLSLFPITFDWTQVTGYVRYRPLRTPDDSQSLTGIDLLAPDPSMARNWSECSRQISSTLYADDHQNTMIAAVFWFWIITPAVHYSNTW